MSAQRPVPKSILIVGSGVFGLSTAYALTQRKEFEHTSITVLDRVPFPAADGSSVDSSRIIRADYDDYAYAALMATAHSAWRGPYAAQGIYKESGLLLMLDSDSEPTEIGRKMFAAALENVKKLGLKVGRKEDGGQVEVLLSEDDVKRAMGTIGGWAGAAGYVNWTSGWADAEAGLRYMWQQIERTGRVELRHAEVKSLIFEDGSHVAGVNLVSGEQLKADLTFLAAGAWTPKLLDLRGVASASGQVLTYVSITPEEQERLSKNPVVLGADGLFIIPPIRNELKIARHGYGYANPTTIENPEKPGETITVSLPRTKHDDPHLEVPQEGKDVCRRYLAQALPDLASRPFKHTRVCWYTDTPTGDWLIDYHPKYSGLFVATGGSGHAYKFLPVVGERIVDVMQAKPRDELGEILTKKWTWPKQRHQEDHIWTDDWRGGKRYMNLDEELAKGHQGSSL